MRSPELLAPAGDAEAMRAAVANGADAVYFGLGDFNARHRAANFTLEELSDTLGFLHEHGVRGYVTFNTLIFSEELPRAVEYLAAIARAGADAVIVQDLGIAELIRRLCPELPVHGSTQMTLTAPRGIEFVRQLGVERVILARELSVKEIRCIRQGTTMPLEVFVHGALCVAYSGQCLTSEALGGRSANRGQCAQACRQPYELIVDGRPRDLGDKAYLLSPQDLAAYDLIDELSDAGVCSFKIEGRLKSAHYVAATTQTYRAAIDAAQDKRPFALTRQQELDLAQSFSRGFTHGFLSGVNHQDLVQGRFPKSRGVRLGTIVEVKREGVVIELDEKHDFPRNAADLPVRPGDGVVIDEGRPEQDEQGGRVFAVELLAAGLQSRLRFSEPVVGRSSQSAKPQATRVELTFGRGDVNLSAVSPGSFVWKTDDPVLRRRLENSWQADPRQSIPLDVSACAVAGRPLELTFRDVGGNTVQVIGDTPLPVAQRHPLTVTLLREQLGRLGGTPFCLRDMTLSADAGPIDVAPVMVPKSVLNDLRRRAVQALLDRRRQTGTGRSVCETALDELRSDAAAIRAAERLFQSATPIEARHPEDAGLLVWKVLVRTLPQLKAVLAWQPPAGCSRPALVYCDFEDVRLSKDAVPLCRDAGIPVALATPRIVKPGEDGLLLQIAHCQPDGVLVRNLAALAWFRDELPGMTLLGDYSLNVANELTAALFTRQGLRRLVPSFDLNLQQLREMLERIDPAMFEIVLHQHLPMFHMEHCVFSHVLSNGKDSHDCGRPCDRHRVELRDHVGESHPLAADVGCRNTVFNAHAQSAAPYLPQLRQWGVRQFRVELLRESPAEAQALLSTYSQVLAGRESPPAAWNQLRVLTQLGVTRGTLEFA